MTAKKEKGKIKKNTVGRPRALIDWVIVDQYLKAQCKGTAVASILGIHPNTLYEECKRIHNVNFSEYSSLKKGEGIELLKAAQYKEAMSGNVTMQIWLGKQYLQQSDRQDIAHQGLPQDVKISVTSQKNADALQDFMDNDSESE